MQDQMIKNESNPFKQKKYNTDYAQYKIVISNQKETSHPKSPQVSQSLLFNTDKVSTFRKQSNSLQFLNLPNYPVTENDFETKSQHTFNSISQQKLIKNELQSKTLDLNSSQHFLKPSKQQQRSELIENILKSKEKADEIKMRLINLKKKKQEIMTKRRQNQNKDKSIILVNENSKENPFKTRNNPENLNI